MHTNITKFLKTYFENNFFYKVLKFFLFKEQINIKIILSKMFLKQKNNKHFFLFQVYFLCKIENEEAEIVHNVLVSKQF